MKFHELIKIVTSEVGHSSTKITEKLPTPSFSVVGLT